MKRIAQHIGIFCFLILIAFTGLSEQIQSKITEYHFKLSPHDATGQVVLVGIDAKSLHELSEWPWPRSLHAQLIKKLEQAGVSEIAFDIDFSSTSTQKEDAALTEAIKQSKSTIILPSFLQIQKNYTKDKSTIYTQPNPIFTENSWLASVNIFPGRNGLVDKVPYGHYIEGKYIPSVSSMLSGDYKPNADNFYIDFSIMPNTVPIVSYVDVLKDRVEDFVLQGKKVIIGATATELGDHFYVPSQGLISGPMLQILATETLLQNRQMHKTGIEVTILGVIILALMIFAVSRKIKLADQLYLFAIAALSIEIFSLSAHIYSGLIIDTALWQITLSCYFIITLFHEIDIRRMLTQMTKQELENTQQVFEQVFNDSFTGTIITNEDGHIRAISNSAQRILQQKKPISKGMHYSAVLPTDIVTAADRLMMQSQDTDSSIHYSSHTDIPTQEGDTNTIEYIVTLSTLNNLKEDDENKKRIISFSFQDITARHKAEIAQKEATYAAISANKAKTEFLTTMSHELRTPLNSILGFSDIIQNQSLGPNSMEKYAEFASDIQKSGRQLLNVVNNILEVTRMESGAITLSEENCDILDMLEYAIEESSYELKNDSMNIILEHSQNLPGLFADAQLCQKTFGAIISNAIKFSKPYEEIIITANVNPDNEVCISVKDNGEGISKHEIENIFKPFYQIDSDKNRHFEGSGLGLTTANAYVKLHGGIIKVDSSLGKGSTFHIIFPAKRSIENPNSVVNLKTATSTFRQSA